MTCSYSARPLTPEKSPQNSYITWMFGAILTLLGLAGAAAMVYLGLVVTDSLGAFHNKASLADVDNDGHLDVLVHTVRQEAEFTAFGSAGLWINDGEGGFAPRDVQHGGGWDSAALDANQDGAVDFLLTFDGSRLTFLQGSVDGGAEPFNSVRTMNGPRGGSQFGSIHVGDLNGDGRSDVFVAGCCGRLFTLDPQDDAPNQSWIWLNGATETGRLVATVVDVPALEGLALRDAALGDLNGDGHLDLFAAVIAPEEGRNTDPADRVLFNDGSGAFTDSGQRLGSVDSTAVALGDVDGDGDLDALVGHANGAALWLNDGGGVFVRSAQEMAGGAVTAVFLQDLNGDGHVDALIGEKRQARIWWNDGDGTFTRDSQRFRYTRRHGLAVGDFNGDGRVDIFVAAGGHNFKVWLNQGDGRFR